jgi:hypothetical protein
MIENPPKTPVWKYTIVVLYYVQNVNRSTVIELLFHTAFRMSEIHRRMIVLLFHIEFRMLAVW